MSKFKVGDKVRYVNQITRTPPDTINLGDVYIVDEYDERSGCLLLKDRFFEEDWWQEERFELVESADSPQERLYALAKAFIKDQYIFCEEDIYQSDRVIENAYQFLAEVFAIVGEQE